MSDPQGLVYDPVAEDYERGRTSWPIAVADGVEAETVLELAAGTGKLTRILAERFPHVIAVEPLAAMREVGAGLVPAAEWLEGTAEALPLRDRSVEAAFVADAFHWFDAAAAARELGRVIRPGGPIVIVFALFDGGFEPELPQEAVDAVRAVSRRTGSTGAPKIASGEWQAGFDGVPFGPLEEREIGFEHRADRDGVVAYYLSLSTVAARLQSEREQLAATLRKLLPETGYRVRVRALVYRARRL